MIVRGYDTHGVRYSTGGYYHAARWRCEACGLEAGGCADPTWERVLCTATPSRVLLDAAPGTLLRDRDGRPWERDEIGALQRMPTGSADRWWTRLLIGAERQFGPFTIEAPARDAACGLEAVPCTADACGCGRPSAPGGRLCDRCADDLRSVAAYYRDNPRKGD